MRIKSKYLSLCCALCLLGPLSGFAQSATWFVAQPQSSITGYNGEAVITALANGSTAPINYQFQQWQGSTWVNVGPNSTLNKYNAHSAGTYRVVAQNGSGATTPARKVNLKIVT